MDSFTVLTGVAAPLMRTNIDTDTIIRIERMTGATPQQMAPWAFESLRFRADGSEDPGFVLNQAPFRGAPILLVGDNFGCGSSREGAVWALKYSGVRCVIAPGFGDMFYGNCFRNGLLPVVLSTEQVEHLAEQCAGGDVRVTVDLQKQVVVSPQGERMSFGIEAIRREALLEGLDDIGLTLKQSEVIAAFQARDQAVRPWVWQPGR